MNIKIINPIEFPNWNNQVANLKGATIFHTANWAKVLSDSYGYKPKYFCTLNKGKLTNLIPVMEINSPFTGKRGVSLPFSDQVEPLVNDQDDFQEMLESIILHGRTNGWRTLDFHGGNGFFNSKESYTSFISPTIDLNRSSEDLFKAFRSSNRRNIRKAKKLGVIGKISGSEKSLKEFYRLNCLTRKDHGIPPQPGYFFDNIHKNIVAEGKGFTCLGYYAGKAIAGVVFLIVNNQAVYKYGASDKRFLYLRPNNLVMAEAITWALKYGIKTIDLGRTEKEPEGQLVFKMGWSAKALKINYFKIDIPSGKLLDTQTLIRSSYFIFKKIPVPILKTIGNFAYRHIG